MSHPASSLSQARSLAGRLGSSFKNKTAKNKTARKNDTAAHCEPVPRRFRVTTSSPCQTARPLQAGSFLQAGGLKARPTEREAATRSALLGLLVRGGGVIDLAAGEHLCVANGGGRSKGSDLVHDQRRLFRQIAFAPEPILHCFTQLRQRNTGADFHLPIGDRQCIVENAGIGEVPHGETIQPLQGAGAPLAIFFVLDAYLSGEHYLILITEHTHDTTEPCLTDRFWVTNLPKHYVSGRARAPKYATDLFDALS